MSGAPKREGHLRVASCMKKMARPRRFDSPTPILIALGTSISLCACGMADDDQRKLPDKMIGPVRCATSATTCAKESD